MHLAEGILSTAAAFQNHNRDKQSRFSGNRKILPKSGFQAMMRRRQYCGFCQSDPFTGNIAGQVLKSRLPLRTGSVQAAAGTTTPIVAHGSSLSRVMA